MLYTGFSLWRKNLVAPIEVNGAHCDAVLSTAETTLSVCCINYCSFCA
jgi:hypothetical protein